MPYFGRRPGFRGRFLFFPLVAGAAALALGWAVMSLWNFILPDALHAGQLNFWQGVGLLVLCRLLFGGFGPGRRGAGQGGPGWQNRMPGRDKWRQMSDDERQQFRQQWQARARPFCPPPASPREPTAGN